jgi:hypothetical protein
MKKGGQILFTSLLLLVLCSGCASRFAGWVRPDTTEQEMLVDRYACEKDCYATGSDWSMFYHCMQSKGYVKQK